MKKFSFNGSIDSYEELFNMFQLPYDSRKLFFYSEKFDVRIFRYELEAGLTAYHWAARSQQPLQLLNQFSPYDHSRNYILYYSPEDCYCRATYRHEGAEPTMVAGSGLVFQSRPSELLLDVFSDDWQGGVLIHFTHAWLIRQMVDARKESVMSEYLSRVASMTPSRLQAPSEAVLVRELLREMDEGGRMLLMKSYVYQLLSFLYKQVNFRQPILDNPAEINSNMIEVEQYILQFLKGTLPSIDMLASKFYLSTSTLKRHFRKTYQRSVYDYYLFKKLELAEAMLNQGVPVARVANELGYESVSHFSQIYKKYFGMPPGKSRQK